MNINILIGHTKTGLGALQQAAGGMIGNRTVVAAGRHLYFCGKGQISVGEAQEIIKRCINRMQAH
jgi:uncharacterized protein YjbJ (UPF0337 family)